MFTDCVAFTGKRWAVEMEEKQSEQWSPLRALTLQGSASTPATPKYGPCAAQHPPHVSAGTSILASLSTPCGSWDPMRLCREGAPQATVGMTPGSGTWHPALWPAPAWGAVWVVAAWGGDGWDKSAQCTPLLLPLGVQGQARLQAVTAWAGEGR